KTYDGTDSAVATPTITSGSLASGDTAAFSEAYVDKNVGTGKELVPSGTVDDGNAGANYVVDFANDTTGVISSVSLTASVTADSKVYDGATTASIATCSLDGVIAPDVVNCSSGSASFSDKNVGTGKTVTAS